ncbi:Inner membrane transport permease ybhS [Sebaldella termitidis]|uniref:ABC-2 type transporter n=1 Tax=Sebaldella termitidis (strain ATCC 33386 / NCTC 11300) TaxID=526218 RepID=D1AGE3_SEBTE|nr:ABC transporter permease [Sebaldella termitidis]ACZ10895.1 ABC-2 type transporter [Sebaldella termitidis ATCC 33386]MBP7979626.1 ABC transporter permease [Sebaldella sp.]SUI26239.1 Inner membrane transport permease ybhS [Sebaldella termitidis]
MIKNDFLIRLTAMTNKEFHQLMRDNSSILIGIFLPIILIFIIGYGVSLDVKKVPIATVLEDTSPTVHEVLSFLNGSEYFAPIYVTSMHEAKELMDNRDVDAIIRIPSDFSKNLYTRGSSMQLILYGVDSTTATTVKGYVEGSVKQWEALNKARFINGSTAGIITVENRMWFNDANSSIWYFIPGLIVLIITIVGVFLTSLVMAREWERGTLESLFISPVKPLEILLSKMIPYFCIAMIGLAFCLIAARFLFKVPIHGSLTLIILSSMLYLLATLGMGLTISSITKNQFLASQIALVVSFLPAMMLTGFLFDLRSVPFFIRSVGQILPATYYLQLLKSLFLAGNNWNLIFKNCFILFAYAVFFVSAALKVTKKTVE